MFFWGKLGLATWNWGTCPGDKSILLALWLQDYTSSKIVERCKAHIACHATCHAVHFERLTKCLLLPVLHHGCCLSYKDHTPSQKKEKKRQDYTFWPQFNEKPSHLPCCPRGPPQTGSTLSFPTAKTRPLDYRPSPFASHLGIAAEGFPCKDCSVYVFPMFECHIWFVCPLALYLVSLQLLETELTGLHCRSLVIVDQGSQTAALNADLLVELLSHNPGPQKRESTAANLLPASGEHYAQVRYHLLCAGCSSLSCTISYAQVMQYLYAWVIHHLSCVCCKASLMHRSYYIYVHGPHTISHV